MSLKSFFREIFNPTEVPKAPPYAGASISQILNPDYSLPVIYGQGRTEGNIVFYEVSGENNKYLDIVLEVCEGEIEGFHKVFMDDGAFPLFQSGTTFTHGTTYESTHPIFGKYIPSGSLKFDWNHFNSNTTFTVRLGSGSATFTQISLTPFIGADLETSLANLATFLNSSGDFYFSKCNYTSDANYLHIESKAAGTTNNLIQVSWKDSTKTRTSPFTYNTVKLSGGTDAIHAYATFYNGLTNQTADSTLTTAYPPLGGFKGWLSTSKLDGIAYAHIRLVNNPDLFSGGIPSFSFEVKGKKVYDPRTTLTAYSTNNAVCLRDYLLNDIYGQGLPSASVSDAAIIAAANICDTLKPGYDLGGTPINYKTYEISAVVDTEKKVIDNLAYFLQSMNASLPYVDGIHYLTILGAGNTVLSTDFSEDNIIGPIEITSPSKNDKFNKVTTTFRDEQVNYKPGEAIKEDTALIVSDGQIFEKKFDAPYVAYYPRAMDMAQVALLTSRRKIMAAFTTTMLAMEAVCGDIVSVSYDTYGWVSKEFRLENITLRPDGLCDVLLSEHFDSYYSLDQHQEALSESSTTLADPRVANKPYILSLTSDKTTVISSADGSVYPRILVTWQNNESYPLEYHIFLKKSTESTFTKVGAVSKDDTLAFYISNLDWNTQYDVGVAVMNGANYVSAPAVGSVTVPNPLTTNIYTYPNVRGLELIGQGTEQGQGNDYNFTGKDIRIQWRLSSNNVTFEFGSNDSEAMGGATGVKPFTLTHYRVEIYHVGDTQPRQTYLTTNNYFEYTLDKNIEDGGPQRTVIFKVVAVGQVTGTSSTGESETPAVIQVTNPQPKVSNFSSVYVLGGYKRITVELNHPSDADYVGTDIHISSTIGFTPSSSTLVGNLLKGITKFTTDYLPSGERLESSTVYYVKLQPYDEFGKLGLDTSSAYTVRTNIAATPLYNGLSEWAITVDPLDRDFIETNLAGDAVPSTKIANLTATKITSGTIIATEAILVEGTIEARDTTNKGSVVLGPRNVGGTDYVISAVTNYDTSPALSFGVDSNGNAVFAGTLSAATGTFAGSLSAATGTFSGHIQGSTMSAPNIYTSGSTLSASCTSGATTIYLRDTSSFTTSGSGFITDSTNKNDAFSWTGKTATTLTGCSGVLAHGVDANVLKSQAILMRSDLNELYFYGDNGIGSIENLASIGINTVGADYVIAKFGSTTSNRTGVYSLSTSTAIAASSVGTGIGVYAENVGSGYGLFAISSAGSAIYAINGSSSTSPVIHTVIKDGQIGVKISLSGIGTPKGHLTLAPINTTSPSWSAEKGTLVVDTNCILWINTNGSTTWQKIGTQT